MAARDVPIVVCVKKAELAKRGYNNYADWARVPGHVYIGRSMEFYVPGTKKSKWHNPYSVKKYGLEECLRLYEEYLASSSLSADIAELRGVTELGCWCAPGPCHGDVLVRLLKNTE